MPIDRPNARDAVDVLRRRFQGFVPRAASPDDDATLIDDPGGALALRALHEGRAGELADNLLADEAATLHPTEGYVPGEPGRRIRSNASALMSAHVGRGRLERLAADMAADPDTGDAAQQRVQGVQDKLAEAATTARPEVDTAARAVADRNAFATFLKSKGLRMGEYEAAASPAAQAAAEVPLHAQASEVGERLAREKSDRDVELAIAKRGPTKYTAPEQAVLDSAATLNQLGPQLMALMEQDNPGIGADPSKYGSWTDMLGAKIGGGIYRLGKSQTPNGDKVRQLTGFLEAAIPRMLNSGRLNQQQYEDLKLHAPQVGFSDGANYERISYILSNIMPAVLSGIDEGHGLDPTHSQPAAASAPLAPATGNRRDPNRGM